MDVLQNARGYYAVPPYVPRAVPQASVSTPLTWNELASHLYPQAFTLRTTIERLPSQSADLIAPLLRCSHGETTHPPSKSVYLE